MNHFDYRDGVLHAEDVAIPDIAAAVGTPFYCYSTATLTRHYTVFAEAFAGLDALVCYAMKANSNQAVLKTLAQARRRRRRGFGRRAAPRARRRHSGRARSCSPASARRRARWISRSTPASSASTSNPSRSSSCCRRAPWRSGKTAPVSLRINPDVDARTHAKISTGKAENKFGIAWRARPRRSMPAPPRCRASRSPASTCISAARSPSCSPSTTPSRCWPSWSATLRADGHAIEHVDLGGGLGIPYRDDNDAAAAARRLCRRSSRSTSRDLGCKVDLRAGPADRRQCRHPRHRGDLREGRRRRRTSSSSTRR